MRLTSFPALLALALAGCNNGATGPDPGAPDLAMAPTPDLTTVSMCTAAVEQLLGPIDKVSTGTVSVLSDSGGVKTLYIDASAGGISTMDTHPRIYVSLASGTSVAVTDKTARTSKDWDLALKRPVLFTNDGDGGPGAGGSLSIAKAFEQVTAADAAGQTLNTEAFVDDTCNAMTDPTGAVLTTMSDWYDYDPASNMVTPKPSTTWIIRGANGTALYKLAIDDYYATSTGMTGSTGGHYKVRVATLQ
jgi:hypothetical protein